MQILRNCFILALILAWFSACNSKKKPSLAGEDPVEIGDFVDFFPDIKLPYQVADTSLLRKEKEKDSLLISYKVFTQFIPDSVMRAFFGKNIKPKIYPIAKTKGSEGETYFFTRTVSGDKRTVFLFVLDKKEQFADAMEMLRPDQSPATQQSASMDKGHSVFKTVTRRNADGTISDGRDVYGFNSDSKKFTLIMTDPLDENVAELINPIDTFPRKHKFAADYGSGKMNLVSIRDGRKKDRLGFFIHFEKNNGACKGELKGEAIIKSPTMAEYREGGDPCVLRFTFTASSVILKEMEGCGAHRGLRCSFDGSFARKKEPKAAVRKVTTKK